MRPLALAQKYMDCVFSDANIEALNDLLADEFTFKGPLYEFDSVDAYIQSLQSDPPQGFEYEMIQSFETESCACLVYQFSKPGVSVPMAQIFEISNGKISRILLIFDTRLFT
ncbi:MAG: nuclear transport factor 2 family protein [Acidiferrobacterales bacterium]